MRADNGGSAASLPFLSLIEELDVPLDADLLDLALTHRSYAYEHGQIPTNERLEFLGDSVLGVIVTEYLYRSYPDHAEGQLAKLRAMPSAPAKDLEWRSKRIAAIKARSKNQLGDPEAYKAYIRKHFGADSLSALATDELQRTYTYIMAKKAPQA